MTLHRYTHVFSAADTTRTVLLEPTGENRMDISASLTAEEVATLSDPDRPCEEAMRMLHVVGNAGLQNGGNGELVTFEASLRIKNTLDVLEERGTAFFLKRKPLLTAG